MPRQRVYSKYTQQAALLMGQLIKLARKQRRWSQQELADRADVGRSTVQKAESGDLGLEIGLAFEIASIAGVPLFAPESSRQTLTHSASLERELKHTEDLLSLLPRSIHKLKMEADDAF